MINSLQILQKNNLTIIRQCRIFDNSQIPDPANSGRKRKIKQHKFVNTDTIKKF